MSIRLLNEDTKTCLELKEDFWSKIFVLRKFCLVELYRYKYQLTRDIMRYSRCTNAFADIQMKKIYAFCNNCLISIEQYTDFNLTEREKDVLIELVKGSQNAQIAEALCLSVSTVKVHIRNIYLKLQVNRRILAYAECYKHNIICKYKLTK